jgi:hypothetical protein
MALLFYVGGGANLIPSRNPEVIFGGAGFQPAPPFKYKLV